MMKFDVLDGFDELKVCVVYKMLNGEIVEYVLLVVKDWEGVELIYEILLGWLENIFCVIKLEDLL